MLLFDFTEDTAMPFVSSSSATICGLGGKPESGLLSKLGVLGLKDFGDFETHFMANFCWRRKLKVRIFGKVITNNFFFNITFLDILGELRALSENSLVSSGLLEGSPTSSVAWFSAATCRSVDSLATCQPLPIRPSCSTHQILISTLQNQSDSPHDVFFLLPSPLFLPCRLLPLSSSKDVNNSLRSMAASLSSYFSSLEPGIRST
ncbi:hypothetical protein DOY81_005886 [Sarcophaga bullata]|nr:hypothetical protein DOY81_005886 [Sarcophaga bullata]